jgi:rhamnosyl/mannosyltransferase
MRVLHIGKYYPPVPGGMEYFLADLLIGLERIGVVTAAIVHQARTRKSEGNPHPNESPAIYRVPTLGRLLYAPVSPSFPFRLNRAISDFQPQLLHLHLPNTSAFAVLISKAARRLPWIIQWQSDVVTSSLDQRLALSYGIYRPLEQRLLARSQAVIASSPPYLESSVALRPWRARCTSIPLGLDPRRLPLPDEPLRAEAERRWGNRGLRVLAVGRLTYYKGHDVLVKAAAHTPDVRVIIAGSGERQARLAATINQLGLEQRVSMLGFVSDAQLTALMATCDVLCLPSLERTEAFGIVLLEAMRFAKPVVVSDIEGSGTGWVVRTASNGLLTEPGNATALAAALQRLQQQPFERRALGERGHEALASHFNIDIVAEQVATLYADVLRRRDSVKSLKLPGL